MDKNKIIIYYDIHDTLLSKYNQNKELELINTKVYNEFLNDKQQSIKNPNIQVEILTCTPFDINENYAKKFNVKINTSKNIKTIKRKECIQFKINFLKKISQRKSVRKVILKDNIAYDLKKALRTTGNEYKNIKIYDPNINFGV